MGALLSGTHRDAGGRFLLTPRHRWPARSGDGSLWPHLPSAWCAVCILSSCIHPTLRPFRFLPQCRLGSGQPSGFHLRTNPVSLTTESSPGCRAPLPSPPPSHASWDRLSYCARIPPPSWGHTGRARRRALEIQREGGPGDPPCCLWLSVPGPCSHLVSGALSPCTPGFSLSFPTPCSGSQPRLLACLMHGAHSVTL